MGDYYNISGENDEIIMVSRDDIVNLIDNEHDNLLHGYAFDDIEARVVAQHRGYVTYVIENSYIVGQCWAGEFSIGRKM